MKKHLLMIALFCVPLCSRGNFFDDLIEVTDKLAGPRATHLKVCEKVEKGIPLGVKSVFSENTAKIFVWFRITGFSKTDKVKSIWYYEHNGVFKKITQMSITAGKDKAKQFHIAIQKGKKWPIGKYRVEILTHTSSTFLAKTFFRVGMAKVEDKITVGTGATWGGIEDKKTKPSTTPTKTKKNSSPKNSEAKIIEDRVKEMINDSIKSYAAKRLKMKNEIEKKTSKFFREMKCSRCKNMQNKFTSDFKWQCLKCGNKRESMLGLKSSNGATYAEILKELENATKEEIKSYKNMGNNALKNKGLKALWNEKETTVLK